MNKYFDNLLLRVGALSLMLLALATGCTPDKDEPTPDPIKLENLTVYVINSGGFNKANASMDAYAPVSKTLRSEVFNNVNGIKLGDTAQSGTVYGEELFVAVNSSNVVFKIDAKSGKRLGQIEVLGPRYIHIVSPEKGYISHMGSGDITIFNPKTMAITGKITTYQSNSTEGNYQGLNTEMWLKIDDKHVMVSCWSYHNKVLVIDVTQDKVIKTIEVGLQPKTMDIDKNGKVWVISEGQWKMSEEKKWSKIPSELWTIDTKANYVAKKISEIPLIANSKEIGFPNTTGLTMNIARDAFYYINAPYIFKMSINDKSIPTEPFIKINSNTNASVLKSAPNGDLYIADVKDHSSNGEVFRYSASGEKIDSFIVGVIPNDFVFYVKK